MCGDQSVYFSPLRYPGGKGKLANFFKYVINRNALHGCEYAEVYAGGAGVALALLLEEYVSLIHINDFDPLIYNFWFAVVNQADQLCRLICDVNVTIDEWHRQKAIQANLQQHSALEIAFSTFFLNRTNRSGILTAGVIGGKNQTGVWKLDARYQKEELVRRINNVAKYGSRIRLYNLDGQQFIETTVKNLPAKSLVFLDPPYFVKGQDLYRNYYAPADHVTIAAAIGRISQPWVVTYDSAPEILRIYEKHSSLEFEIRYSAQKKHQGRELLIYSDTLDIPAEVRPLGVTREVLRKQAAAMRRA